ncbi:hypothetical protein [Streptomyces decoyicus]|uniref:hypothetical protein n=1 Tax=Streptomyces decoyicus TaxID=249567 RepID=UPI003F4C09C4
MDVRGMDGSAGDVDYGSISAGYASSRRPDPRIAQFIAEALGGARTVLNVGAGFGSYESAAPPSLPWSRPSRCVHSVRRVCRGR